jgi:uncharacterized protein YdiU (UPF0061 family)
MSNFANSYCQLPSHFYRATAPEPLSEGLLIHTNQALMTDLSLQIEGETLLEMTKGKALLEGFVPIAQKYTGHQFGYYNPALGDGRGLLLGQVFDATQQPWDLHLKGSGRTPYSRRGDGRAVLRSAIREYLIGETLHAIGVSSTRCLSICHSPEPVRREQLEDRASYIRVAKTHVRFGQFEWLAQLGNPDDFKQLANYVIKTVYPEHQNLPEEIRYAALLNSINERTALLMAGWQASGFCHGVMNTDNMSVAGETFDFGPYAFLDDCNIHYICNHSDTEGRYAYSQQPNIGLWNCQVLGHAFSLIVEPEQIEAAINTYIETYNQSYLTKMCAKFGLGYPQPEDKHFIADSLILMEQSSLDFHYFFQMLALFATPEQTRFEQFLPDSKAWKQWMVRYQERMDVENNAPLRQQLIRENTPKLILRNYIAQEIIQAAESGDYVPLTNWFKWLQSPYHPPEIFNTPEYAHYLLPPAAHQKKMALSCSS